MSELSSLEQNVISLLREAKVIYSNFEPYVTGEHEAFDSTLDSAINLVMNRRLHRENMPLPIPPLGDNWREGGELAGFTDADIVIDDDEAVEDLDKTDD